MSLNMDLFNYPDQTKLFHFEMQRLDCSIASVGLESLKGCGVPNVWERSDQNGMNNKYHGEHVNRSI